MPADGDGGGRPADRIPASSVARTLATFADPWTFGVLVEAFFGKHRFKEFLDVTGFPKATLSSRLARLAETCIFRRVAYSEAPPRYEYHLTRKGMELFPVLLALAMWGERWLSGAVPLRRAGLIHKPCGKPVDPEIVCAHCRRPIDPCEMSHEFRPDAGFDLVPKDKRSRRAFRGRASARPEVDALVRTLDVVGDRWSFLVIREVFFGVRRFEGLREHLRIARNVLADRLRRLTAAEVLRHDGAEYRLTGMGRDLYGSLAVMLRWGDKWLDDGNGPPLVSTHLPCGHRFCAALACRHCHKDIEAWDVIYAPGRAGTQRRRGEAGEGPEPQ